MALLIEIKAADGLVSRTRLEPGTNRFSVRLGDSYRLIDDQTGLTPPGLAVKRVDNNLVVERLGTSGATVEFVEFYSVCSAGSPCDLTVNTGSGEPRAITPGTQPIGALADGSFVLYDPTYAETAPAAPSSTDGAMVRNVLYGVGGLAVVGLAAGGGGGGDAGDAGPPAPAVTLKLSSPQLVNTRTPTISGEGEPGSRVIVRMDTNGDGVSDVTYNTLVDSESRWSINLASTPPESGALPPAGLPDSSVVSITSATSAGNVSLPVFTLTFDGTPPVPALINAVATDNVINAAEKQAGFFISGTAEPGSSVILSVDGQALASTTANAAGQWQTENPLIAATVPADGSRVLSAVVQDAAGNLSAAAQAILSIDTVPPPLLQVAAAGGDSRVAMADAASVGFAGRTDPNAAVQVQWNGGNKSATADAGGGWSVAFSGPEVPDSPGANFPYSIVATDLAGNIAELPGQILVDRQAPAAPVINAVEGDNNVTPAERTDGVTVSGQGEVGSRVQVAWGAVSRSATTGGDGQWAVQFGAGDLPPVSSPGGTTNITATLTDDLGNLSPASQRAVTIEQPFNAPIISPVEGDNIVNLAEASNGAQVSGTVQAGAAVNVSWGGVTTPAVVSGTTWTATVPVPGDGQTALSASITGAGGGATSTRLLFVDKTPPGAPLVAPVELDDIVSREERLDGVVISGQAEAGSTINVAIDGGLIKAAATDAAGGWSVTYTAAEFPAGPGTVTMSAIAIDGAGNPGIAAVRPITVLGLIIVPDPGIDPAPAPVPAPPPDPAPAPVPAPLPDPAPAIEPSPDPGLPLFDPPGILLEPAAVRLNALLDQDVRSSGLAA